MMTRSATSGRQRRVNQAGLRRLQLAAVAASAFRVEEQIVLLQHLGDVRLQRDQVGRILGVAPDRDRAGDVAVDQAERAAEQVDAGGDQRRPDAVVVEHERLDQIVGVAACGSTRRRCGALRDGRRRRGAGSRACARSSGGSDRADAAARGRSRAAASSAARRDRRGSRSRACAPLFAMSAAQVLDDFLAREDGLGDLVEHRSWTIPRRTLLARWQTASANSRASDRACRRDRACGRVRRPAPRPSAAMIRSAAAPSSMCRSIITAESSSAVGLARFLPAMSGALPCTASNTPISVPRFAAPTTPRPPTSPAHRSETMSP